MTKFEPEHPRLFASLFISSANFSTLPDICSAMAIPASLPEHIKNEYKSFFRVILSPSAKPHSFAPYSVICVALYPIVTTSSRFPYFNATSAVTIFVVLAGYIF